MSPRKLSAEKLREIHELAAGWGKIVARRAFGEAGPDIGVDLTAMEEIAATAAAGLTESTLSILLQRQARCLGPQGLRRLSREEIAEGRQMGQWFIS